MSDSLSPIVSIVMNCYNGERFLREAIDSVYQQGFQDWEIIFWDNASTDSSAEIAQSYDGRVKYHLAPNNTPLGEARNHALQQARGKYIAFLDCDDLYLPDKLEKQFALMESGGYALSYGSAITINEFGVEIRRRAVANKSGNIFGDLLKHYEINMQSVMVRHDILRDEGLGFAEGMKYCPDYNLFMDIASRYPLGVISDYIVKYRVVSNSLSRQSVDIAASEIKFSLDRILSDNPSLKEKFGPQVISAYVKLHYYDAVAAIYQDDRKEARIRLRPAVFHDVRYLLLYLALYFPLPSRLMLRLLRR